MYIDENEYLNFSLSPHRKPLFEADDDNDAGAKQEAPANNAGGNEEEAPPAEDNEDTNTEETPNEDENADEEPPEEDFDINGEGDEEGGDEGDEEGGEETEEAPAEEPGEVALGDNPEYTNPNIDQEKDLYDSLSPEEQQMKDKSLRKQYADLYTNINQIIEKLDSISVEMEDVHTEVKRMTMILYEFKQLLHDYFINLYNSKSYIENLQNYEKYKLFLHGIKNIISTIDKASDAEAKDVKN